MDKKAAMRRIAKEARAWTDEDAEDLPEDVFVDLIDDNPTKWRLEITPSTEAGWSKASPYLDGTFFVNIDIDPTMYPQRGPSEIRFSTAIFHPAIEEKSGKICTEFTTAPFWDPNRCNMSTVISHILTLLKSPCEPDNAVNSEAMELFQSSPELFLQKAKEYTARFASD